MSEVPLYAAPTKQASGINLCHERVSGADLVAKVKLPGDCLVAQ